MPIEESLREISRRTGKEFDRIRYAARSRGVRPSRRVGNTNLYGPQDVKRIEKILRSIDARREAVAPAMETVDAR